jgi:ATP-dependent Clp protease ATP-binding subunit ClpX
VKRRQTQISCSFCGKPRDEVRRLVAGPGVFICTDCVRLSSEILAIEAGPPPSIPPNQDDRSRTGLVMKLPAGERWRGLVRRVRRWRTSWSGSPSLPAE